jgi:hypothetical protein
MCSVETMVTKGAAYAHRVKPLQNLSWETQKMHS